jgi:hypothetical protein
MLSRDEIDASAASVYRVGPYEVSHRRDALLLCLANRGELGIKGCALFAFTMLIVLVLGALSTLQVATAPAAPHVVVDDPGRFFAPRQNHFGFLWLFASALMLVIVPLYVLRAYKAPLVFEFRRSEDTLLRDGRPVTRLRRIENLSITETKDPDSRYLYLLEVVYGDGHRMLLHNAYEEREVMNLANEISAFVGTGVVWQ